MVCFVAHLSVPSSPTNACPRVPHPHPEPFPHRHPLRHAPCHRPTRHVAAAGPIETGSATRRCVRRRADQARARSRRRAVRVFGRASAKRKPHDLHPRVPRGTAMGRRRRTAASLRQKGLPARMIGTAVGRGRHLVRFPKLNVRAAVLMVQLQRGMLTRQRGTATRARRHRSGSRLTAHATWGHPVVR